MLSRGTVVEVTEADLIIMEYDSMEEEEIETVYECDDDIELVNLASLTDLDVGDFVEVVYEEDEDGFKKAVRVVLK